MYLKPAISLFDRTEAVFRDHARNIIACSHTFMIYHYFRITYRQLQGKGDKLRGPAQFGE
jgi:hypothetical protein